MSSSNDRSNSQVSILPISLDPPTSDENNEEIENEEIDEPTIVDAGMPIIQPISTHEESESKSEDQNLTEYERKKQNLLKDLEQLEARMLYPTSKRDILFMLGGACKVVTYDELDQYNTLTELLNPYQNVVILYPNAPEPDEDPDDVVGHWCCIFKSSSGDRIEFFDSYGSYIDDKIKDYDHDIDEMYGSESDEEGGEKTYERLDRFHKPHHLEPKLLKLLYSSDCENVHWNDCEYQCSDCDSQTCGLWCVARLKNKHLNESQFKSIYHDGPLNDPKFPVLPDILVSGVISMLYPEMRVAVENPID